MWTLYTKGPKEKIVQSEKILYHSKQLPWGLRVKEELQRYQAELESKGYRMPDCDKEA